MLGSQAGFGLTLEPVDNSVLQLQEHQQRLQLCSNDMLDQLQNFVNNFGASGGWLKLEPSAGMPCLSVHQIVCLLLFHGNLIQGSFSFACGSKELGLILNPPVIGDMSL